MKYFLKSCIRFLFLIIFELIGFYLYKNLNIEEVWKFIFADIYGGIGMAISILLSIDF